MNRIPILAGGAVLAAVVLCSGGVAVANAMSAGEPSSQVLSISGVSTSPTSSASASTTSDDSTSSASPTATASASPTAEPSDDKSGVTVVSPSDPTKIVGKGCGHVEKHGADDPANHATDDNGVDGASHEAGHQSGDDSGHHMVGTPVTQDPNWSQGGSGSSHGGSGTSGSGSSGSGSSGSGTSGSGSSGSGTSGHDGSGHH